MYLLTFKACALLGVGSKSLGNKPVNIIFAFGFDSWNIMAIAPMPLAMSLGSSRSVLLVPTWTTIIWALRGISPFSTRHKTFCVLAPPIPKFKAFMVLKYLLQILGYRANPWIIESPIRRTLALEVFAISTCLSCSASHPCLLLLLAGVVASDSK